MFVDHECHSQKQTLKNIRRDTAILQDISMLLDNVFVYLQLMYERERRFIVKAESKSSLRTSSKWPESSSLLRL